MMTMLPPKQQTLVSSLIAKLGTIADIKAVVLGGSHARGCARPDSDIDLGLFYSEAEPFSVQSIRELAESVNDTPQPVVSDFYGWGAWVNGGAWLTINGQRVDFIYRNLEHVERVIAEAESGSHSLDYLQQPPFGFFSATYLGEVAICLPLFDPKSEVAALKQRVAAYPEALRRAVVQDYLWQAEFNLYAFAHKFAKRADSYGTVACLSRVVNQLILVLFALNRAYLLNDKTALAEVAQFALAPQSFAERVQHTLAQVGDSPEQLALAVENITALFRETVALTDGLYQPRFTLPV